MQQVYNYLQNVTQDVLQFLNDNYADDEDFARRLDEDPDAVKEELYDELWVNDDVTGNASGSYTFNANQASQNLVGNWDLIASVIDELGYDKERMADPEYWDVSIRCFLLNDAIDSALDEFQPAEITDDEDTPIW